MMTAILMVLPFILINIASLIAYIIFRKRGQRERGSEAELEKQGDKLIATVDRHRVEGIRNPIYYLQYHYHYHDTMYQREQQVSMAIFNSIREGNTFDVMVDPENPHRPLPLIDRRYWKSTQSRINERLCLYNTIFFFLLNIFTIARVWHFWSLAQGR